MPLQVGSRLGHYDVTALIGEGGMGQVYQATDTKPNRHRVPIQQPSTMLKCNGIIETALYVDDMRRSVGFYQEVFGFPALFASERLTSLRVLPGQVLLIMKKGASTEASVMPFGMIPSSDAAGQQHVAFGIRPEQLDEWRNTLKHHGVEIESALDWPEGGHSLYFRDPDGHCIEVKTTDWDGEALPTPVSD